MALLADIVAVVFDLIGFMIRFYMYVILAAVVVSWVGADPYNPVVRIIRNLTDPVLLPMRRRMWRFSARVGLDFSPMVVMFALILAEVVVQHIGRALVLALST